MTIRESLQINDGWFPDIMEHLQYRYFLEGYMWIIESIEKQIVQRVPFDMFVNDIFGVETDVRSNSFPFFSFSKTVDIIDNYIWHNYHKEA